MSRPYLQQAFLATLPGNLSHYSPLERIRIVPLVGATSESSEYFPGVVLQVPLQNQDIFTAVRRKKRAGLNLSVALFSTSLAGDIEGTEDSSAKLSLTIFFT